MARWRRHGRGGGGGEGGGGGGTSEPVVACYRSRTMFLVLLSVLYFLHGLLAQYSATVMGNVGRRYRLSLVEVDFVLGVEKIGFVVVLLFIALFGNRIHKPRAVGAGALLAAAGALLCAVPYFVTGNRIGEDVSVFVEAGLCAFSGAVKGESQCYFLPKESGKTLAFSMLSLGMFVAGVGAACFATIGLVYLEEISAAGRSVALRLGIALSARGIGQCLGALLATWFSSLAEAPEGRVTVRYTQEVVGAWWLGFVFLTGAFAIVGLLFMPFPRWVAEPEWFVKRRAQMSEYARYKEEKRKNKITSSKVHRRGSKGRSDKGRKHRSNKHKESKQDTNIENSQNFTTIEEREQQNGIGDSEVSLTEHRDPGADSNGTAHAQEPAANGNASNNPGEEKDEKKRKRRKRKRKKRAMAEQAKRPKPKRIRSEKLKDLPKSLLSLLKNPLFILTLLGSTLVSYVLVGYTAVLVAYLKVQFQASPNVASYVTGVSGHLSWGLGTLVGGFLIYKKQLGRQASVSMVMVCVGVCAALTLILMAFSCDVPALSPEIPVCAQTCDCSGIQYEPVCGSDGVTYISACHAGCEQVTANYKPIRLNMTDCSCAGGQAWSGACTGDCSLLWGFAVLLFIALTALSIGQVPVILIFLRCVKDRGKSLSLGFAVWVIYLIGYVPGPVLFKALGDSQCELSQSNCAEEEVCWDYNRPNYNYLTHGVAAGFLVTAIMCFFGVWFKLRRTGGSTSQQEDSDPEFGRPPPGVTELGGAGEEEGNKPPPYRETEYHEIPPQQDAPEVVDVDKNNDNQHKSTLSRVHRDFPEEEQESVHDSETGESPDDLELGEFNLAYLNGTMELNMTDGKPTLPESGMEESQPL